jgi:prepilin-type N-terminal cleavage/methylation domain-containing protein
MHNLKIKNNAGFALFELLVALAIFGILAMSILDWVNHDISSNGAAKTSRTLQSALQTLTRMAITENGATMVYVPSTHDDVMPYLEITSATESMREKLPYHAAIQLNGSTFTCIALSGTGFPTVKQNTQNTQEAQKCAAVYFSQSGESGNNGSGLYTWTFQDGSVGGKWVD